VAQAKLIRSRVYRNSLVREYQYIAQNNPNAAEMVVARIERATTRLREFPLSGPGWRIPETRELVIPGLPYIVIYRVTDDAVELVALFHSSQEIPNVP
jgi:toxin ParE1/3/4